MVKNPPANTGDIRDLDLTLGCKIPWRKVWQPILVFLPGESHGQTEACGATIHGAAESDMTKVT